MQVETYFDEKLYKIIKSSRVHKLECTSQRNFYNVCVLSFLKHQVYVNLR